MQKELNSIEKKIHLPFKKPCTVSGYRSSHLHALKHGPTPINVEKLKHKTILIAGLGGIGALTAEILSRCGTGRLLLFDKGTVEMKSLCRMFYRPEHVGMAKIQAARMCLGQLNPNLSLETYHCDICSESDAFKQKALANGPIDLILSTVDNISARRALNQLALELSIPLMDIHNNHSSSNVYYRLILPGNTACMMCLPDDTAPEADSVDNALGLLSPATLPPCETLAAGLIAQAVFKFLLKVGEIVPFFTFDTLSCALNATEFNPNPNCPSLECRQLCRIVQERQH